MKKLIAAILSLIMILSLTGCGADTMVGTNLSMSVKGSGKSKLKLSITDKIEEECTIEYILCDEGEEYFSVSLTKETEDNHSYEITPVAAGNHTFAVIFKNQDEVLGVASLNVIVNEALKMYYSELSLSDITDDYQALDETASISTDEGGAKTIQLSNADGYWEIGKYDDTILSVSGPELSSDGTISSFHVGAVGEGETVLYLVCRDAEIQMMLSFKSSLTAASTAENAEYYLSLVEYTKGTLESTSLAEGSSFDPQEAKDKLKDIAGGDLPEGVNIEDAVFFDEITSTDDSIASEKPDILCEIVMNYNGIVMDYQTSKTFDAKEYSKAATDSGETAKEELAMTINNYKVTYYYLSEGCGIAVWDNGDIGCRMTFTDGNHTSQEYKDMLTMLLEADAI